METKHLIQLAMAIIMIIMLLGLLHRSIKLKKGIGARTIQFICIGFLLPTIVILALEKTLSSETIGTLLGGIAGYVLSGISNYDSPKTENKKDA